MSYVFIVNQNVKSQHFLSVCPSDVKSQARIIQMSPMIQRQMPFVQECPCVIYAPGTRQQQVLQGDQVFQWISQSASKIASASSSSSPSASSSFTEPSDSLQGYDVTMNGNTFAFLSSDGNSTFMDSHGMGRCSELSIEATSSSAAGSGNGLSSGRVSKNNDIMEKFEAMKSQYNQFSSK